MTMIIEIGKGRTIGVEPDHITTLLSHDAVKLKMVKRALKEMLSDANAGIGARDTFKSDAEYGDAAYAASMKLYEAMLRGEVRGAERGPRVSADPIAAEALRLARVFVGLKSRGDGAADRMAAVVVKLGLKQNDDSSVDFEKRIKAEWIKAYAAKPETIAEATANVEATKAKMTDDTGL